VPLDADKAGILDRLSPDGQKALLGQEIMRLGQMQESVAVALDALEGVVAAVQETLAGGQKFFSRTASISATVAGTRIHLLAEADLPEGKKAFPLGFFMILNGEVSWTGGTGTAIYIADSGTDLIYRLAAIEAAQLVAGNYLCPDSDGVTLEAECGMNLGCRTGKGIDVLADADFGAGSDLVVTVYGYMA